MFNRRDFLSRTLQGTSLLAAGTVVPQFLANTARAAGDGKDTILVVIELTGGNDGLNTVIPYADDLYHKARPTLRFTKEQVVRVDDHIGLHPAMRGLEPHAQGRQPGNCARRGLSQSGPLAFRIDGRLAIGRSSAQGRHGVDWP